MFFKIFLFGSLLFCYVSGAEKLVLAAQGMYLTQQKHISLAKFVYEGVLGVLYVTENQVLRCGIGMFRGILWSLFRCICG